MTLSSSWALAALLFAPVAGTPPADDPAAQVARLFEPSARVQASGGEPVVYPIKRRGEWGFARKIQRVEVSNFQILAFELMLAKIDQKDVPAFAKSGAAGAKAVRKLVAVVFIDDDGIFRGKPDGFPLERAGADNCMDLDCGPEVLSLSKLTVADDVGGVALLRYEDDFKAQVRALIVAATPEGAYDIHASKPIALSSTVAPCEDYFEIRGTVVMGSDVSAMLLHKCTVEDCTEHCEQIREAKGYEKWPKAITRPFEFPTM